MRSTISPIPLLALVLVMTGCGAGKRGDDKVTILASGLASAIRTSDEAAFVQYHVQPEDMSPSGAYWLATKAGGVRPDAAWDREVRDAFAALQHDLKTLGLEPSTLEFARAEGHEVHRVDDDEDRQNLQNLRVRMKSGNDEYTFSFSGGILSQRGWVLTGNPRVTVEKASAK